MSIRTLLSVTFEGLSIRSSECLIVGCLSLDGPESVKIRDASIQSLVVSSGSCLSVKSFYSCILNWPWVWQVTLVSTTSYIAYLAFFKVEHWKLLTIDACFHTNIQYIVIFLLLEFILFSLTPFNPSCHPIAGISSRYSDYPLYSLAQPAEPWCQIGALIALVNVVCLWARSPLLTRCQLPGILLQQHCWQRAPFNCIYVVTLAYALAAVPFQPEINSLCQSHIYIICLRKYFLGGKWIAY